MEKEGKTILEHIGIDSKKYGKIIKKMLFFMVGGLITGVIIDTLLNTNVFATVVPLGVLLLLLFKLYNK
jgi:hypothetical protein